jgi:O-acetyl-ADP-ribose deacetylase (regulator of RNase III)
MVASKAVPKMTSGRAALVVLMNRYLSGLLDPFVTLLEIHKLMYFMQEAGEPLKLRYTQGNYGPYAENLRHVLKHIEGHLISGYADGGDAPDKQLVLVPGAVSDAQAFLRDDLPTRKRFDRIAALVDGFETPYGLELLATVHWVVTRCGATSLSEVVHETHNWNERKRQFTERQIGLAYRTLLEQCWFSGTGPSILSA